MFRGDFRVSVRGKLWLRDWCSYHGTFFAYPLGRLVKYAVVGDPSTAPGQSGSVCTPVSGRPTANGDLGADSMAVGYAQQLAQTITGTYIIVIVTINLGGDVVEVPNLLLTPFPRLQRLWMVLGLELSGGGQRLRGKLRPELRPQ